MAHSFFKDLFSFTRYSSFCFKIDNITNSLGKKINHKIKNISGNISLVPFKLVSFPLGMGFCLNISVFSCTLL